MCCDDELPRIAVGIPRGIEEGFDNGDGGSEKFERCWIGGRLMGEGGSLEGRRRLMVAVFDRRSCGEYKFLGTDLWVVDVLRRKDRREEQDMCSEVFLRSLRTAGRLCRSSLSVTRPGLREGGGPQLTAPDRTRALPQTTGFKAGRN